MFATYFHGIPELIVGMYQWLWVLNVLCAGYCMNKGQQSGRKIGTYFILGSLLGPIGMIVAKVNCSKRA